ncbi:uncharacterized protein LOC130621239 [Hydractinia symbiolongicarpus]|uniref:uncharacterized protein LOC130621239 n=1 Tax=Hydractinia symbiolongicarpus TaxID=13093 RepID=UPI00254DAACD|nr:uncharacterized protein LOC130621239 [Hydractinia symbiolongicarpus]
MVLKGLPDQYKAFVAIITQSETVDTFHKFKQALRNFDETETARSTKPEANKNEAIMKARNEYLSKQLICYSCGVAGHKASECRRQWCTINDDFSMKINGSETLLVDCGATTHIVNSEENMIEIDNNFKPAEHYIELKRGLYVTYLRTESGELVKVNLENALYVPTYPQNIFSVQAATRKGAVVNFSNDHANLIAPDGTIFPIEQRQRLYYLYKNNVSQKRIEDLRTWHRILGHCNIDDVIKLESVL